MNAPTSSRSLPAASYLATPSTVTLPGPLPGIADHAADQPTRTPCHLVIAVDHKSAHLTLSLETIPVKQGIVI